ncbi:MAG TPA: glycosyltransferase family A protein [Flavobacterium sp.]|nr:glycosyltransferase family A protein [Flavobacterium sp.]
MNPLVSIITPTYNHEKFINECIESVQAQTFTNWEMIIINDGSTDNTLEVIKKYAINEPRIRIIDQQNIGIFRLAETYNKALQIAKGNFIAILEGDDYWESGKLETQLNVMQSDAGIIMGWGKAASRVKYKKEIYQIHPVAAATNYDYYFNSPGKRIFNAVLEDFFPPLTYLIRKDALEKIGGFIQRLPFPAVDLSTVLALSQLGRFHFFNEILGTWRIFPEQTTKTLSNDIIEGANNIIIEHYRSLSPEEKKNLKFDEEFILDSYKRRKIISLARSGRFKLIKKQFADARKDYIKAISLFGTREPVWKLRALVGLVFSWLHMDVEKLATWFGKGSLK